MKKNKTIKTLLAGLVLSTGVFLASPTISEAKLFTDLNKYGTHTEAITYLNELSAFDYKTGNTLNANSNVTRAEASKVLYNLYNSKLTKTRTYKNNFKDVTSKTAFSKEMIWAYETGIFGGVTNTQFQPNAKLTRAQMAVILVKTFDLKSKGNITFKDVKSNHWAKSAISILATNGITNGDGKGNFMPNSNVTVAQLSSFIYRIADPSQAVKPVASTPSKPVETKPVVTKPVETKPSTDNSSLKSFEEVKALAIAHFQKPVYQPEDIVVYSATPMEDQFSAYNFESHDMSQDVPGMTFYGRTIEIWSDKLSNGTYKNTIKVINDRDEVDQIAWEKRMDKAEAYIVANYKLDTEYDVVVAINDFVGSQISYGSYIPDDHEYLVEEGNATTCNGYTDLAATLYKRFGIKSRILTGNVHSWNVVQLNGEWYHTDATGYDSGDKKNMFYITMSNGERAQFVPNIESDFKASDVRFDPSTAKPYTYKK